MLEIFVLVSVLLVICCCCRRRRLPVVLVQMIYVRRCGKTHQSVAIPIIALRANPSKALGA
jgi:hypothetical protein